MTQEPTLEQQVEAVEAWAKIASDENSAKSAQQLRAAAATLRSLAAQQAQESPADQSDAHASQQRADKAHAQACSESASDPLQESPAIDEADLDRACANAQAKVDAIKAKRAKESPAGSAPELYSTCPKCGEEYVDAALSRARDRLSALERELAEARADARRKALNDAIKVCDNLVIEHVGNSALTLDQCAEAIRTLATERKETEG